MNLMKEYYFDYRGGEIVATVKANSLLDALEKFDKKIDVTYKIESNILWSDLWTYECDELSVLLEEELSRKAEDEENI